MPNITNKEWIDNNNLKIDDLITQATELPDYQDIEPIYQSDSLIYRKLNFSKPNGLYFMECLGSYLAVYTSANSKRTYTIYKILDNGNLTSLVSFNVNNSSYFWHYLVDYDDDYVYFYRNTSFNYQSNLTLYRVPVNGRYC